MSRKRTLDLVRNTSNKVFFRSWHSSNGPDFLQKLYCYLLLHDLVISPNLIDYALESRESEFSELCKRGLVLPFADYDDLTFILSSQEAEKKIAVQDYGYYFDLSNKIAYNNLVETIASDLYKKVDAKVLELSDWPRSPHPQIYCTWASVDAILSSLLDCPVTNDFDGRYVRKEVYRYLAADVSTESRGLDVLEKFLQRLTLKFPLNLSIDDLCEFRKDNVSREFRGLFNKILTSRLSEEDALQDLMIEFQRAKDSFNEAAQTFADWTTMLVSGIMASTGGLLGGVPGAVLGGVGASVTQYFASRIFRELYASRNGNWAYYFLKWK